MGRVAAPVALYLHIPFCVSLCPYCDFVVFAGAAARGPKARIDAFLAALHVELDLRADALDAAFPGGPPAARDGLPRGWHAVAPAGGGDRRVARPGPRPVRHRRRRRDHRWRRTRAPTSAATRPRFAPPASRVCRSAPRRCPPPGSGGWAGGIGSSDVVRAVAEARAAGIGSVSLDLLYDAPDATLADWIETLDAALALEPDHLSLYALTLDDPDAEGLTGPGGDHLPTTPGARRWRATARPRQDEDRAAAEYHHAVHRLAGAGWRGYEISNWARPGHESRHNPCTGSAGRTRRSGRARTRSTVRPGAGTPPGSTATSPR